MTNTPLTDEEIQEKLDDLNYLEKAGISKLNIKQTAEKIIELESQLSEYRALLAEIQKLVDEQSEDEGLWFAAETAPEAYLQHQLRTLHALIETKLNNIKGDDSE